ncbi:MAG TPA: 2-dehydropantoate 2-reductase [Pseudolabrys sp.]|jgi:2-dehydropantoate 2-reductase|nr:2-dehydropantoate 2-reductase [Pseudolabrys sp.]
MRIAVMAAGAVGGYYGARMAAAGHDVFFIARGAHRDAMLKDGLRIDSVNGDLHLPKVNVTDDPATVGPVDIVLFAVKLWDTEKAADQARPLLGPKTRVITLQNGVDSYERIAPIVGPERAIAGVTYVVTVIERPGVIKQASKFQSIICGAAGGRADAPLKAFVDAAKAAHIDITLSDNIERDRWHKFIFLSATSGVTAVTRSTMGPILADPDTRALFRSIMAETLAVGRAKGVALDAGFADERMAFADKNVPAGMKASMANDLDRGNRLELDWLAGQVSKLGKELKVPTPVNDTVYAALKLHRMGAQR